MTNKNLEIMTENQQRIIDSLIAEFNSRNEKTTNQSNSLINLDELDEINQRHRDLEADAKRSLELWEEQRKEYIDMLVEKIHGEIGHRLRVKRGDVATSNPNVSDQIYIYTFDTPFNTSLWESALRFKIELKHLTERDNITKQHYRMYNGIQLSRYVTPNSLEVYKDEVEFFNCQYTKDKLKNLIS